jgi:hypothetical protein
MPIQRAKRPMTFTCEHCSKTVTEPHGPGQTPKYCTTCHPEAERHITKMRVREHRKRQAEANPPTQSPGRPRKS